MRQLPLPFQDADERGLHTVYAPSPADAELIRLDEQEQALARLATPEARQAFYRERAQAERRAVVESRRRAT